MTLGQGHVAYGDRRHLVTIASYWQELRESFKNDEIKLDNKFWEGVILAEYMTVSTSFLSSFHLSVSCHVCQQLLCLLSLVLFHSHTFFVCLSVCLSLSLSLSPNHTVILKEFLINVVALYLHSPSIHTHSLSAVVSNVNVTSCETQEVS